MGPIPWHFRFLSYLCEAKKNKLMKQTVLHPSSFRFRRWSRKAYAAFASIGRHVTIGCVNKRIADKSLSKQESAGTAGKCWEGRLYPIDTEELRADKETPPDLCLICLQPWAMGGMLSSNHQEVAYRTINGQDRVCKSVRIRQVLPESISLRKDLPFSYPDPNLSKPSSSNFRQKL